MSALVFPPLLPSDELALQLEDQHSTFCTETNATEALMVSRFSPSHQYDCSESFQGNNREPTVVMKKLYRNARERDRRKKINTLYSSLRLLLPPADHKKKLSNPAIVSLVLKYIPELQGEVQKLAQKKEEVSSRIYMPAVDSIHKKKPRKSTNRIGISLPSISASWLNDTELVIHISAYNSIRKVPLSEILFSLEDEDGLHLRNASSFESFEGIVVCNLHFQVMQMERTYRLDAEVLIEKLLALYETKEEFP